MVSKYPFGIRRSIGSWWRNRRAVIWTSALLAFFIRIAAGFALKLVEPDPWYQPWEYGWEYGRIARWLVEGGIFSLDGIVPTSETDPLYSFIIAPLFYLFGSFTIGAGIAIVVLQALLCGLIAWAIFVLGEKLYGSTEARLSALLFALYPGSIFFAVARIGPSSLAVLLLALTFLVILAIAGSGSRQLRLAGLGGVLAGLLILTSGHMLSLLIVIPLWFVMFAKVHQTRRALLTVVFVGTAVLVLVPWSVRNSIILGEPAFSKSNLDYHLWVGNNPNSKGYYVADPSHAIRPKGEHGPPYYQMAFSWIEQNPEQFITLTTKRIMYFWYISPERASSSQLMMHARLFLLLLGFALYGVVRSLKNFERVSLVLLFLGIFPLLFYVTHASYYRHRSQLEPFVLILASHGVLCLGRVWSSRGANAEKSAQGINEAAA